MVFNIWMFHEILEKEYSCQMVIKEEVSQTLENIRLFFSGKDLREDTMYVETGDAIFKNGDQRVYCVHRKNYFIVESVNVNEVFNSIITILEETQIWINHINMIISNNGLLSEVLNEFADKIPFPLMVLDASQTALAIAENFGKGSIDDNWDRMIETGSLGMESITTYNELYKDSIYTKEFYDIPANPFPFPSFNRNIFINDDFMGFLSLIRTNENLTEGIKGWYYIAWECVTNWMSLHASQNDLLIRNSVFEEIIRGDTENLSYFEGILSTYGWHENCSKRLIVLGCVSNHLNMNAHIVKLLNRNSFLYAIEHQEKLVVLCNTDQLDFEKQLEIIKPIIHNSGYYGGSSNTFTHLSDIPDYLLQAMLTFQTDQYRVGEVVSCQEYILPYILHLLKANARMSLIHPALSVLSEYDKKHRTNYYEVLKEYLHQQCNQTDTANALCMHRSSLLRKISFIHQLTEINLADYQTRLHLLISYELNQL